MADEGMASGEEQAESGGQPPAAFMANVPRGEQMIVLGAALLVIVSDLIGDVFTDNYSIYPVQWLLAAGALIAVWAVRMGGRVLPISAKSVVVFLGYASLVIGIRGFIDDIESASYLGSDNIVYALAAYIGGLLMGLGAYQAARSGD